MDYVRTRSFNKLRAGMFENLGDLTKAHVILVTYSLGKGLNCHNRSIAHCDCEVALVYKLVSQEKRILELNNPEFMKLKGERLRGESGS